MNKEMLRRYTEAIELRQKSITESRTPALSAFSLLNSTEFLINSSNFQEVAEPKTPTEDEDFPMSPGTIVLYNTVEVVTNKDFNFRLQRKKRPINANSLTGTKERKIRIYDNIVPVRTDETPVEEANK